MDNTAFGSMILLFESDVTSIQFGECPGRLWWPPSPLGSVATPRGSWPDKGGSSMVKSVEKPTGPTKKTHRARGQRFFNHMMSYDVMVADIF